LRDSVLIRPHPVLWFVGHCLFFLTLRRRLITGVGILYLLALTFMLQLKVEDARDVVHKIFSDAGRPLPERSYAANCSLYDFDKGVWTLDTVKATLMDEFIIAHLLGWYFSALMIRDVRLCLFLSVGFEIVEVSLQHWLDNFRVRFWLVDYCAHFQ